MAAMESTERAPAAVLTNTKVRDIIQCFQCGKFQCLYSEKALTVIQKSQFQLVIDEYDQGLVDILMHMTSKYKFVFPLCNFEQVVKLRGINLVNNQKNSNNIHKVFATLENQGQSNEAYRRIDCDLLINKINICQNCQKLKDTLTKIRNQNLAGILSTKISHASQEILANKVQLQRKVMFIIKYTNRFQQKVEDEKEAISDDLGQIAQKIANRVTKNKIDISSFSPIFQELIRIQCNQAMKGIRYHPIFLQWVISVYSQGGWQNKTAYQILQKMTVENISIYGRTGFLSHDSFKIQKGLLWSQCDNRYIGYLDFEDEKKELQSFMMKCEKELQEELQVENLPNSIYSDCEQEVR
ncbi:hypothetical protein GLOIN_2v1773882 [Rhizophagus irregularis DAOM 181602=DAOM 197198]|nr:hypothetical protein GLOIN_2v1773882 [Rhizophagus irregularis DAOM 181602=DAOM 197198]